MGLTPMPNVAHRLSPAKQRPACIRVILLTWREEQTSNTEPDARWVEFPRRPFTRPDGAEP